MEPVRFEGIHASIEIRRPADGIVVLVIEGTDAGELGEQPFREIERDIERRQPSLEADKIELFVDARATRSASMEVSAEWSRWLAKNQARLHRVNMVTGTKFIQMTAEFVRRASQLGELMRIYTDPAAFDEALAAAVGARRVYVDRGS